MDEMIEQVEYIYSGKKKFAEDEKKEIASYLIGEKKLGDILGLFPKAGYGYCNSKLNEKILREVEKEKSLLFRLGRYLIMLSHISENAYINSLVIFYGNIPNKQLFIDSGLGSDVLLNYNIYSMLSTYKEQNYNNIFADIYSEYPEAYDKLGESDSVLCRIFANSYIYYKTGKHATLKKVESDIKNLDLTKLVKNKQKTTDTIRYLAAAFCITEFKIEILKDNLRRLIESDIKNSFNNIFDVLKRSRSDKNRYDYFMEIEEFYGDNIFPGEYLIAYMASLNKFDNEFFKYVLKNDVKTYKAAISISLPPSKYILLKNFWDINELKEEIIKAENMICGMTENNLNGIRKYDHDLISMFRGYLEGTIPVFKQDLELGSLPEFYTIGESVVLLFNYSKVSERFLKYVISQAKSYELNRFIFWFKDYYEDGQKVIINFIRSLGIDECIKCLVTLTCDVYMDDQDNFNNELKNLIKENFKNSLECVEKLGAKEKLFILKALYEDNPAFNPEPLLIYIGDSSKQIRETAVLYLSSHKEFRPKIEALVNDKKKNMRESAESLLRLWDGSENIDQGDIDILAYCKKLLTPTSLKSIEWIAPATLPTVRWNGKNEIADETVVKCYIYLYLSTKVIEPLAGASQIRAALNKEDLVKVAYDIYSKWINTGAEAKRKGALFFAAAHCDDRLVVDIRKQIDVWAENSRGAIASEAIKAIAFNGSDMALVTVDAVARKFKNKQVRKSAQDAFAMAAKALNITPEQLSDRIVPSLGFDEKGERVFDFGPRKFIVSIDPTLELSIRTESGKTVKSLPSPASTDDPELAAKAKSDLSALKKTLKVVVSTQKERLEFALSSNRRWTGEEWTKLFVKNPIMHVFAMNLIWGNYKGEKLAETFRYMEDGTFNTVDEEEYTLPEDASISLVHPLDMTSDVISAWLSQLSDYEIKQPFLQLERSVFKIEDDEKNAKSLERFGGKLLNGISLMSKLTKLNWYRGSVQDGGWYYTFYKQDKESNIEVQLNFSGMGVGYEMEDEVTVYDAVFYKANTIQHGSYVYDDVKDENIIKLSDVPARIFSEITYDLEQATASSTETDKNWKTKR
ncbi:MAG: DUF4132 domain-containing protein [Clostridiales bacterium]|nr:DUF4132 domain-containing protein [Clostridiales bacterium]